MSFRVKSERVFSRDMKNDLDSDRGEAGTVLIVDDDASIRKAFKRLVSTLHMKSIEAESGIQALQIVSHTSVDVILCDVEMPRLDGISMYYALSTPMQERVLLLSGSSKPQLAPDGVLMLQKPVTWSILERAILDILHR